MAQCIDLMEQFGDQYRVAYEESYGAERGDDARRHDPWLLTIECQFGHIYPQGGNLLSASTNRRGPVANRLVALPCVRVIQEGDDGFNVVFHVSDFDEVAAVMKPRRRRRLTPDQRAERVERLRKYQFTPATHDAGGERRRDGRESGGSKHSLSRSTRS
jgi:hypothetical protein